MRAYVCVGCSSQNFPEGKLGIPEGPQKFPEGFPGSLVFGGAYCKRLFDAPHMFVPSDGFESWSARHVFLEEALLEARGSIGHRRDR